MFEHEFEKENVRHFVENGSETVWGKGTLKEVFWLLIFLGTIPFLIGIEQLTKGFIANSLAGLFSIIPPIVIAIYMWREKKCREEYFYKLIRMGIGGTSLSAECVIFSMACAVSQKGVSLNAWTIFAIYTSSVLVITAISIYGMKRDWYKPKISKKKRAEYARKMVPIVVFFSGAGALVRAILDSRNKEQGVQIIVIIFLIVSILGTFSITNFLKAYYVKKYGFTDPYEDGWYKPKRRKLKEAENEEAEIEGEKSK